MQIIIIILLIILLAPFIPLVVSVILAYRLILWILKVRYFRSETFLEHKESIRGAVAEYNELADYIDSFEEMDLTSESSDRYRYSHLATTENLSLHNIKRDRNTKNYASNVHQTSLQVVIKAAEQPLKYLCKYFDVKATEENLQHIQEMANTVSRFSNAEENLQARLSKIETDFKPPWYIKKYYRKELLKRLEIDIPTIDFEVPVYQFEYVSSGGNSSQRTTIKLDEITLESLSEYLSERIKYGKSAKAQRALMTRKLREAIKKRDSYTCQNCKASVAEQSLLLLEVDHIVPVSKGGLSTEDNLQTLCWKCNRSKSNKTA